MGIQSSGRNSISKTRVLDNLSGCFRLHEALHVALDLVLLTLEISPSGLSLKDLLVVKDGRDFVSHHVEGSRGDVPEYVNIL